jgi:CDP-diacylglycerol--serine O-phosphatidyltransferase
MRFFKNIPNFFTLLNLVFGCIAIVMILQTGETLVALDANGNTQVVLPEKIWEGSLFIFAAAIVDFLDGFIARLFRATSKMGAQLDSLSDLVSFGVAPGLILYQLLRISYAQEENGLDVSLIALLPAFFFTVAAAWRLAKFNLDVNQTNGFRGVPTPAAGLLIASFPLIIWFQYFSIQGLFINKWFLYAIILLLGGLMVSNLPLMAMKFKDFSFRNNSLKYILAGFSLLAVILLKFMYDAIWFAVPVIFVAYIIVSLFSKEPAGGTASGQKADLLV